MYIQTTARTDLAKPALLLFTGAIVG